LFMHHAHSASALWPLAWISKLPPRHSEQTETHALLLEERPFRAVSESRGKGALAPGAPHEPTEPRQP